MFMFTWVQGVSNFGFIVMIVNLLPHNMYPKLAAKWGSLIYFSSSFADFTIQRIGTAEYKKNLMCLLFPTLSVARASRNLAIYEYTPGGTGLNWDETLFEPYHNFRIISYFGIMAWALAVHFSIGMLFERYGSVPEILRNFVKWVKGTEKEDWEEASDPTRIGLKPVDRKNFESVHDQNLISGKSDSDDEEENSKIDVLEIFELIKKFRQDEGTPI